MTEHEFPSHEDLSILGIGSHDLASLVNIVLRDDLTDLYNRRYFRRRLEKERQRVGKDQASMALIMMDIDRFKLINDTCGHLRGDKVLVRIGKLISSTVRSIDIVCRYAGDEFVAILPSAGRREAGKIARRIERAVEKYDWSRELDGVEVNVGISVGYAAFPRDAKTLEGLIQKADLTLYETKKKRAGRRLDLSSGRTDFHDGVVSSTEPPPLLERREELARLKKLFHKAKTENPVFTLIEGPAGSGKSRVVEEFLKKAEDSNVIVCRGSSTEGTKQMPLFPVREALASLHRSHPTEFARACKELDHSSLKQLARIVPPGILDNHRSEGVPQDRNHLFATLVRFVAAIARNCHTVIVFEDLQWADEGTRDFLSFLRAETERAGLLVLATVRCGYPPVLETQTDTGVEGITALDKTGWENIVLENLSARATARMVKHYLGMKKVPTHFSNDLYRITGGNPVFIRETLVYLAQQNKIEEVLEHGIESRDGEPVLPLSILEMIKGRFRALDQSVQKMLRAASVLGYEFDVRHLSVLHRTTENEIYGMLNEARRENFIGEHFDGSSERFSFNNRLIRDVIYHDTNMRKRKSYHLKIAVVLEGENGAEDVASLERLAHHFEYGERPEKAFSYLVRAGEKAKELYANMESIRFFEHAIEMAAQLGEGAVADSEIFNLREVIGNLFQHIGNMDDAKKTYTALLESENISDSRRVRLLIKIGEVHEKECRYDRALIFLYRALNSLEDRDHPEYKNIVLALSVVFMRKGDAEKALHYCSRLIESGDGEDEELSAKLNFIVGSCNLCRGKPRIALQHFKRSMKIRQRSSDLVSLGLTYVNIGNCLFHLGRRKGALQFWNRAMTIGKRTSNVFLEMACLNNIVLAYEFREDPEKALSSLGKAMKLAKKMSNPAAVASCKMNIAAVLKEVGRLEDAVEGYSRCLDMGEKMDNLEIVVKSTINLGTVYVEIGELEKAENYAWKALELTTRNNMILEEAMSWEILGDVNMERGNHSWAVDTFQRAKRCMEKVALDGDEGKLIIEVKLCEAAGAVDTSPGWREKLDKQFGGVETRKPEAIIFREIRWGRVLLQKTDVGQWSEGHLRRAFSILGNRSPRTMLRWHVGSLLARSLAATGRQDEAREVASDADHALAEIRKGFRSEIFRNSFLSRSDVQEFLLLTETLKSEK